MNALKQSIITASLGLIAVGDVSRRGAQPNSLACVAVVAPSDSGSGRIDDIAPGPGGRLAWTDGRPGQFLLKDSRGRTHVVGRIGSGPGEFRSITEMGWIGDTLWVGDFRLPRIQFFSDTGRLVKVTNAILPAGWGPRPDGRLVGLAFRQLGTSPRPIALFAYTPGAPHSDTLAIFPMANVEQIMVPVAGKDFPNPHPLLPETHNAQAADHSRFCSTTPLSVESVQLRCVDDRGRTVLDRRVDLPTRPVTDSIYNGHIDLFSKAPGRTPAMMRDRIRRPRYLPSVLGMKLGNDGEIWLARSDDYEGTARWVRLRSNGTVRDSVAFPATYTLRRLQGDTVWATTRDSNDLETLNKCTIKTP